MTLSTSGRPAGQTENVAASDTSSVQPPQTQQPAPAATAAPAQESTPNTALPADYSQIDAFLYGNGKIEVGTGDAATAAEPAKPAEVPAAETAPPATDPVAPAPETAPPPADPDPVLPGRIATGQFGNQTQRAIALLRELNNGKPEDQGGHTLFDALTIIRDADAKSAGAPVEKAPDEMETLQTEIDGIESTITQAGENFETLTPDLAKAVTDLTSKKARLEALKAKKESDETRSTEDFDRAVQSERAKVAAEFPSITDSTTILGSRASAVITEWRKANDPRLLEPNAPRLIAEEAINTAAAQIVKTFGGTLESAKAQITGKPVSAPVAAPPKAVPVGGTREVASNPSGAPVAQAALTEQQILQASEQDPEFLDRALGYGSRLLVRS